MEAEPQKCVLDNGQYCPAHTEMERRSDLGMVLLGVGKWAIPFVFALFGSIVGFLFNDVARLEARYAAEHTLHEQVHRRVGVIELNLIRLFKRLDIEYIEPPEVQ